MTFEGARRLGHHSAAESAVVDLLRLEIASLVSKGKESTLVRERRRALATHGSYKSWHDSLEPNHAEVADLLSLIDRVDSGRVRATRAGRP